MSVHIHPFETHINRAINSSRVAATSYSNSIHCEIAADELPPTRLGGTIIPLISHSLYDSLFANNWRLHNPFQAGADADETMRHIRDGPSE